MVIAVRLRRIVVDGVDYPLPSHMAWHSSARRWVHVLPDAQGSRIITGFPARRHGGVFPAYIACFESLQIARKATEEFIHTTHTQLFERKKDQSLAVGIDLDIQRKPTITLHYLRVAVGSYIAGTLLRRNLRLGVEGKYSKAHYDMVYAKAVETRAYLVKKHSELVLKKRYESEKMVREEVEQFIREARISNRLKTPKGRHNLSLSL